MTRIRVAARLAVAAGTALLAAGCVSGPAASQAPAGAVAGAVTHPGGMLPGLRYRDAGTAAFTATPPPATTALPGANDVIVADGADTAETGALGGTVLLAAADSGIWRSADAGATWQRVLSGIQAWSVTAMTGGGYAVLGVLPGPNAPGLTPGVSLPELAASTDGITWHVTKLPEPSANVSFGYGYQFALSGTTATSAGVAVPDPGMFGPGTAAAYRTTDGGRHWTPLPLTVPGVTPDQAAGGVAMLPDGRTIFVTAPGEGSSCQGAVYESRDGGASWAQLPGSCQPYPLQDVQFTSDQDGFAVGGLAAKFGGGQVVEASTDGGATWHVLYRTAAGVGTAGAAFLRIDMVADGTGGGEAGWAISGGCTIGQNGPCPGPVYHTSDGGAQWRATGQSALSLAALASAGTANSSSAAGIGDSAFAVDPEFAAATSDGGRSWTQQTQPATVQTRAFAGTGSSELWSTSLGTEVSADGGMHWSPIPTLPAGVPVTDLNWQAAAPSELLGYDPGTSQAWASDNGGQTWTASTVPGGQASGVLAAALGGNGTGYAVTGPGADCLSPAQIKKTQQLKPGWTPPSGASVLYASSDSGARWSAGLVLPFGVPQVATMAASGTRIAIIDACGQLELSTDAGQHWTAQSLGTGTAPTCTVSELGSELWLDCQLIAAATTATWSLHSADGGKTWLAYRLPATAAAAPGSYPTGPGSAVMPIGGALWRTSDDGKTWTQSWPLPQ